MPRQAPADNLSQPLDWHESLRCGHGFAQTLFPRLIIGLGVTESEPWLMLACLADDMFVAQDFITNTLEQR